MRLTVGDAMDPQSEGTGAEGLPWKTIKRATRYWRGAAAALAVGLLATTAVVWLTRPVFKSETVLLYRTGARQGYGEEIDPARRAGSRLQDMLFSRERFARIVRELKLNPRMDPLEAAEDMIKGTTFRVRDGSTFAIGFEAQDPSVAQTVTRRLADSLIEDNARQRRDEADEHKAFLDQEKQRAEATVRAKESELANFLYQNPAFATRGNQPGSMSGGSVGGDGGVDDGSRALALQMQIEELRSQLATSGAGAGGIPAPALRGSPELVAARARAEDELGQAEKNLAEQRQRLTDDHPDVRAALARVQVARAEAKRASGALDAGNSKAGGGASAGSPTASIERRIHLLEAQLASSRRRSRPLAAVLGHKEAVATELEWQRISREVTEAREKLGKLGDRQFQADLMATLESSGQAGLMVVVDPPYLPIKPTKDPRPKVAIAGIFASMMLAFGWAGLRAATDDRLFDAADVARQTAYPVLTVVPRAAMLGDGQRG